MWFREVRSLVHPQVDQAYYPTPPPHTLPFFQLIYILILVLICKWTKLAHLVSHPTFPSEEVIMVLNVHRNHKAY